MREQSQSRALRDRLRRSLQVANVSPEEMADRLAITPGIVYAWLEGRGRLKPLHMMMWASACGVSFDWLAGTESDTGHGAAQGGGGSRSRARRSSPDEDPRR